MSRFVGFQTPREALGPLSQYTPVADRNNFYRFEGKFNKTQEFIITLVRIHFQRNGEDASYNITIKSPRGVIS